MSWLKYMIIYQAGVMFKRNIMTLKFIAILCTVICSVRNVSGMEGLSLEVEKFPKAAPASRYTGLVIICQVSGNVPSSILPLTNSDLSDNSCRLNLRKQCSTGGWCRLSENFVITNIGEPNSTHFVDIAAIAINEQISAQDGGRYRCEGTCFNRELSPLEVNVEVIEIAGSFTTDYPKATQRPFTTFTTASSPNVGRNRSASSFRLGLGVGAALALVLVVLYLVVSQKRGRRRRNVPESEGASCQGGNCNEGFSNPPDYSEVVSNPTKYPAIRRTDRSNSTDTEQVTIDL